MKRAYLVLGPESTGTRLATSILISGGCYGSAEHVQEFDTEPFGDFDPVVLRRSVPHGGEKLDIVDLVSRCRDRRIFAVITTRDWTCAVRSKIKAYKRVSVEVDEQSANQDILEAYLSIFDGLKKYSIPFMMLSYESLVTWPDEVQSSLLHSIGLIIPEKSVRIVDGNWKHW